MSRKRKVFQVEVTVVRVPLPPEKRWAYEEAWRLIDELILKASASLRAEAEGCAPTQSPEGERLTE